MLLAYLSLVMGYCTVDGPVLRVLKLSSTALQGQIFQNNDFPHLRVALLITFIEALQGFGVWPLTPSLFTITSNYFLSQ